MAARPPNRMPADVASALRDHGVEADYAARPYYQRNDYLGWISGAKRPDTRQRRLDQMIEELRVGGVYMKMDHPASAK